MAVPKEIWGRRDFIRIGGLGFLGLGLTECLQPGVEGATSDRACIFIVLDGGPAQHETFDPKPDAPAEIRGEFKSIPTNVAGIQICEHLPFTAQQADKFAIIRSMTARSAVHFQALYHLLTGYSQSPTLEYPAIGALVGKELGPRSEMLPYVVCSPYDHGTGAGFLGGEYGPFTVRNPDAADFRVQDLVLPIDTDWSDIADRNWLRKQLDLAFRQRDTHGDFELREKFYSQAEMVIRSGKVKEAFDIWAEPESVRSKYGRTPLGQGCLLARRLVEHGVRFVTVNAARAIWDGHVDHFKRCATLLLPEFDRAFATLLADLSQRGLLASTLVVVAGEFGRTPKINAQAGRDHWPSCFSSVLAGAGIKGGQVYGCSDATGAEPKDNPVRIEDLAATIFDRIGLDPDRENHTPTGRPIRLANKGVPIGSPLV